MTSPLRISDGFPQSQSHWPNQKDDVYKKGSGSFSASYVAWARIAQLLHEHAPGVDFHLEPTPDGQIVHKAPDGTGYVLGSHTNFTSAEGEQTSRFPFPCMDHRNNPIQFDKVSARVEPTRIAVGFALQQHFTSALGLNCGPSKSLKMQVLQRKWSNPKHNLKKFSKAKSCTPAVAYAVSYGKGWRYGNLKRNDARRNCTAW